MSDRHIYGGNLGGTTSDKYFISRPIYLGREFLFLQKQIWKGKKKTFSRWVMKYELSLKDLEIVEAFLEKKKKRL